MHVGPIEKKNKYETKALAWDMSCCSTIYGCGNGYYKWIIFWITQQKRNHEYNFKKIVDIF
jgi:hypothetical protein